MTENLNWFTFILTECLKKKWCTFSAVKVINIIFGWMSHILLCCVTIWKHQNWRTAGTNSRPFCGIYHCPSQIVILRYFIMDDRKQKKSATNEHFFRLLSQNLKNIFKEFTYSLKTLVIGNSFAYKSFLLEKKTIFFIYYHPWNSIFSEERQTNRFVSANTVFSIEFTFILSFGFQYYFAMNMKINSKSFVPEYGGWQDAIVTNLSEFQDEAFTLLKIFIVVNDSFFFSILGINSYVLIWNWYMPRKFRKQKSFLERHGQTRLTVIVIFYFLRY